jgi:hypothetical protein
MLPVIFVAGLALREALASRKPRWAMTGRSAHTGAAGIDVASLAKNGIPELLSLVSQDPSGLGVQWQNLVSHVAADAASGLIAQKDVVGTVQQASIQLYASLQQFATATGSGDESQAIEASINLVSTNFTSSGAGQVISGLAQLGIAEGAKAATPLVQDAAKQFTGSLLTNALGVVGGGLAATGVGAAVGLGVSLLAGVFSSLFGQPPPPPYQIGQCGLNSKPDMVIRYTWMWGDSSIGSPVVEGGPGNPNWRSFPEPALPPVKGDSVAVYTQKMLAIAEASIGVGDGAWYKPAVRPSASGPFNTPAQGPTVVPFQWDGSKRTPSHLDTWYGCFVFGSGSHFPTTIPLPTGASASVPGDDTDKRPIDLAMYDNGSDGNGTDSAEQTVYEALARENGMEGFLPLPAGIGSLTGATLTPFRQFQAAFFKAWKQNREFSFNGLKQQPDWKVLEHTIQMWNRAHAPTPQLKLSPSSAALPWPGDIPIPLTPTYEAWLLNRYNDKFTIPLGNDGSVMLNLGPVHPAVPVGTTKPAGHVPVLKPLVPIKLNLATLPPVKSPAPSNSTGLLIAGATLLGTLGAALFVANREQHPSR